MIKEVPESKIKLISKKAKIKLECIKKIDSGFTNLLYILNNKYILKVCKKKSNEKAFLKEIFFYDTFGKEIKHPELIITDTSRKIISNYYIIYKRVPGKNAYSVWPNLKDRERELVIKEICHSLKGIIDFPLKEFAQKFNINAESDWKATRLKSLFEKLKEVEGKKIISKDFISAIKKYVAKNEHVLQETKVGLVYWDLHLDNVIIEKRKFNGLIDFEDIDVMSIDYVLDTVFRWIDYPHLYASEKDEKSVKKKDYKNVKKWFKKYAPELFAFKHLNKRVAMYAIEYDLRLLPEFPIDSLKERLAKTVGYKF
jgi:hypothetical protein